MLGDKKGNKRSTPTPSEILRTVKEVHRYSCHFLVRYKMIVMDLIGIGVQKGIKLMIVILHPLNIILEEQISN